jgi:hypothetical protein
MLAGPRSWMCAPFSAPRAPKNELGHVRKPPPAGLQNQKSRSSCARHGQLRYGIRAGLAFEIHFGARLMVLPLVSLSSLCHRVLIHFR